MDSFDIYDVDFDIEKCQDGVCKLGEWKPAERPQPNRHVALDLALELDLDPYLRDAG